MWFSHIDGDGWNNVSSVEAYRDKPTIAATVILRELIAPYPDLPVAVGVIGADVDERYDTPEAARQAARELYALPQVEVATHSYTHPYQWSFFENYDRQLEKRLIGPDETEWRSVLGDRVRKLARLLFPGLVRKTSDVAEGKFVEEDPPRAYSEFPFDLDQEIRGAITIAEEYAPEGKRGTLYLWSGGAEPFEAAIAAHAAARAAQPQRRRFALTTPTIRRSAICRRSRGSPAPSGRSTPPTPTISSIRPTAAAATTAFCISKRRSSRPRTRAGSSRSTSTITCSPARRPRSSRACVTISTLPGRRSVTPVAASHYAAIADGFFTTQISSLGELTWLVQNRGALQTVRFDDVADLSVDFARSVGVIGQQRKGSSLYVALDEARDDVIVALGTRTRRPPARGRRT